MNTRKKMFLALFISVLVGGSLPTYADALKVSFKQSIAKKKLNTIRCKITKVKGRNRRTSSRTVKVSFGNTVKCNPARKVTLFNNPRIGGFRIDACVHGTGWKKSDANRCDPLRLKKITNEFCKSKGFKKSYNFTKGAHKGTHAILTYKKNKPNHSFWKRKQGHSYVKTIICKR